MPLLLAALLLVPSAAHAATVVKDASGRSVTVGDVSRIVSIGGAVTEILYGLGKDKAVVGIDTTSLYPPRAAAEKPSVGYMRQLSAEGVLGLRPSLVLAIDGSGPKETMAVLKAAQVPLVVVPDSFSGEGILKKIELIARVTDAREQGACMMARARADLAALDRFTSAIRKKKRVLFVLSFVDGRAMVSGRNTAADGIIHMAGAENAIDAYAGYKPISDEALVAARPDVVLAMQRGGPGAIDAATVFSHAAFSATPAGAARAFVSMEGLYLLGFGPRSARAARDLALALYPGLRTAPMPSETAKAGCRE